MVKFIATYCDKGDLWKGFKIGKRYKKIGFFSHYKIRNICLSSLNLDNIFSRNME